MRVSDVFRSKTARRRLILSLVIVIIIVLPAAYAEFKRVRSHSFVAAAQGGNLHSVKAYLEAGGDPNVKGVKDTTAMLWASFRGDERMVSLLLSYGANPNDGLYQAIGANRDNVLRLLVRAGANVKGNPRDRIHTPLGYAKEVGNKDAEIILKQAGAER